MSYSHEDENHMREVSEKEVLRNNVTHQRPHHRRRRGERTAMLTEGMAQIAADMRDIAARNMVMHEIDELVQYK